MRITFRNKDVLTYWEDRWDAVSLDSSNCSSEHYPLKYAEMAVNLPGKRRVLEAGCGAGRLLSHYQEKPGVKIVGIDFASNVIEKLNDKCPNLDARIGNVLDLDFPDESFDVVLAFGLYHNLEKDLEKAVEETYRVLEPGGVVCASARADNLQNLFNDRLADKKEKGKQTSGPLLFHKRNFRESEFRSLFEQVGFRTKNIFPVVNMPLFYKFEFFRARTHKAFDESLGRSEGYRLSPVGSILQRTLMKVLPSQACNLFVLLAEKPSE